MTRLLAATLAGLLLAACTGGGDASPTPTASTTAASTARAPETPRTTVALRLALEEVRTDAQRRIESDPGFAVVPTSNPDVEISDRPLPTGASYVLSAWAIVVHPRAPILDIDLAVAQGLISGQIADWSALVASEPPRPLRFLGTGVPAADVLAAVAGDPDTVGMVPVEALDLSVRALTVEGYDPYRDPASESPLADRRWIAPAGPEAERLAALLGWDALPEPPDPVGFLATGELIPARCTQAALSAHPDGFDAMFAGTRDRIEAADLVMVSWEPAIVDDTPTPCTSTFNMSTLPEAAQAAARAGVDVALAIGNHVGDCWAGCGYPVAVLETVEHLRAAGLLTVGAGEDLDAARTPGIVQVDGVTFAFLGYDEIASEFYGARETVAGTAPLRLETLGDDVRAAKAQADHVVVGFSWGVEYQAAPTERQREAARIAIEAGASLVVGNHPHWVQATERLGDGFVAYGLGNFVFDQDWSVRTTQGAVIEVGFTRERIVGLRLRPTAIRAQHLVEWVDPASEEGRAILGQAWDATDALPAR